jgi:hypothetical protein
MKTFKIKIFYYIIKFVFGEIFDFILYFLFFKCKSKYFFYILFTGWQSISIKSGHILEYI